MSNVVFLSLLAEFNSSTFFFLFKEKNIERTFQESLHSPLARGAVGVDSPSASGQWRTHTGSTATVCPRFKEWKKENIIPLFRLFFINLRLTVIN